MARQPPRMMRSLWGGVLLLVVSCDTASVPLFGTSVLPVRPVRAVHVYSFPYAVQQGDTFTVSTTAFDSTGLGTADNVTARWSLSDSTLVSIVRMGPAARWLQVRGQRVGLLHFVATINGVSGRDSLRIVPPLAPFRFEPAAVTLRRGDSVAVRVVIADRQGAPIRSLFVFWMPRDVGLVRGACCRDSATVLANPEGGVGRTVLRVTSAQVTAELPVTVIER